MKLRRKKKRPTPESASGGEARREADARESVASFLGHKSKRTPVTAGKRTRETLRPIEVLVDEAQRRSKSGEWGDATPRTFVGLYALCHRIVYGEIPLELFERRELTIAARLAGKILHEHFEDDAGVFVEFVKWAWEREKGREAWALREGITDRKRLQARWLFSARTVQDWRVDIRRRRRGRHR